MLNDLHLVVDRKTHQLIGIFDDKGKDKFYVGGDVIMDGELFKNGIKLVKDEYIIWNIISQTVILVPSGSVVTMSERNSFSTLLRPKLTASSFALIQ